MSNPERDLLAEIMAERPDVAAAAAQLPATQMRQHMLADSDWLLVLASTPALHHVASNDAVLGGAMRYAPTPTSRHDLDTAELASTRATWRSEPKKLRTDQRRMHARADAIEQRRAWILDEQLAELIVARRPDCADAIGKIPAGRVRDAMRSDPAWQAIMNADPALRTFLAAYPEPSVPTETRAGDRAGLIDRAAALYSVIDGTHTTEPTAGASDGRMKLGDVWFAQPALLAGDGTEPQEHPVIVLDDRGGDNIWCVSCTSQRPNPSKKFTVLRRGWVLNSGKDVSYARVWRGPETVSRTTFRRRLGTVDSAEMSEIIAMLGDRYTKLRDSGR